MPGHTRDLRERRIGYSGPRPIQARWTHPLDRRVKRERSFATKREARAWMAEQDADSQRGSWTDPNRGRETVEAIAAEWRASRLRTGPRTRAGHDSILARHVLPEFGQRRIATIEAADIQRWVNRLAAERAPSTVHNALTVLRLVIDFGVRRRYIALNPCTAVERPPKARGIAIRPLTHAQVRCLADAMPTTDARVAVLVSAYMGVRAGELWALRRRNVNLLRRELVVEAAIKEVVAKQALTLPPDHERISPSLIIGPTKTRTIRRLSIPAFLCDELTMLMQAPGPPESFVFTDVGGGPVRHSNFYKRAFRPNVPADLRGMRWHDLRHTCASLLIEQGAHPAAIQRHLGHEDIRTTLNIYGHMFPAAQEAMAASMDAAFRAAEDAPDVIPLHR